MKKSLLLFVFSLIVIANSFAQSPQKLNYQALVKDTNGDVVSNQNISVQIKINETTATGTTVYTETHAVTTSSEGLVSIVIGDGTTTDTLNFIQWHRSTFFLNVAVDTNGGTSYSDLGTLQLLSVPYALHANTANSVKQSNGDSQVQVNSNDVKFFNGVFNTFTFTNGKMTTTAPVSNFGNNLQLEFKDGTNTNRINNVFPNVTSLPTPGNGDYELNLNVRGNETLSARGDGTVRINDSYSLPTTDGNTGEVLVTDGSGTLGWGGFSKLTDTDGDTQIQVEETTNDNTIRFDVEGTEYFRMEKGRLEVLNNGLSVFMGGNAGLNDDFSDNENVGIGYGALQQSINAGSNTSVGAFSLNLLTNGSGNTAIGIGALEKSTGGSRNVAIGAGALGTSVGNIVNGTGVENVAIGYRAGQNNKGSRNVFIGYETDISGSVWNKLVIDNSNTTTPLIAGDFFTNELTINGTLETSSNTTINGNNTVTGLSTTGTLKVGSGSTLSGIYKVAIFKNVGNVSGNNGRIETFTVNGASPGDVVFVSPSENLSGQIVIAQSWVSSNNTVSVRFRNTDGGGKDPDGGDGATYYISVIK